jgi:hypothetical protein
MSLQGRSFRTGSEEAKSAAQRPAFSSMGYFKIEDGERAYVQFITDIWEWATVDMHNMVPSKPQPADYTGDSWPQKVSPICRLTKMGDGLPMFDDCYVCANITDPRKPGKPFAKTSRIWAMGVMREEVLGDGSDAMGGPGMLGKRVGFRDKKVEVAKLDANGKPTSEKELKPQVVLFTMGWKNFFSSIEGTAQVEGGSITNLNFAIARTGKELDTTYQITNLGKTKRDFNTPEGAAPFGIKVDPSQADAEGHPLKTYPSQYDMFKVIEDRASAEFYNKYLVPGAPISSNGSAAAPKPSNDLSTQQLDEMQKRIQGYETDASAPAPAPDFEPVGGPTSGEEMGDFE